MRNYSRMNGIKDYSDSKIRIKLLLLNDKKTIVKFILNMGEISFFNIESNQMYNSIIRKNCIISSFHQSKEGMLFVACIIILAYTVDLVVINPDTKSIESVFYHNNLFLRYTFKDYEINKIKLLKETDDDLILLSPNRNVISINKKH